MKLKTIATASTSFVLGALLALGISVQAQVGQEGARQQPAAQDGQVQDRDAQPQVRQRQARQRQARQGQEGTGHDLTAARVSSITGMTVRNADGQSLGAINDLVIDLEEGKVRYAALARGGFGGFGTHRYAISWDLFEYKQDPDAWGDYLLLPIDANAFQDAEGFDMNKWPAQGDPKWEQAARQGRGRQADQDTQPRQPVR